MEEGEKLPFCPSGVRFTRPKRPVCDLGGNLNFSAKTPINAFKALKQPI